MKHTLFKSGLAGLMVMSLAACSSSSNATTATTAAAQTSAAATEEASTTGSYTVVNKTGEDIKELYLYETGSDDKGDNYAAAPLADGAFDTLTYDADDADTKLTLEFTTESGYTAKFTTLNIETVTILMPGEGDVETGATPIVFGDTEVTATYTITNETGENVTGLYLYGADDSDKGENYAETALADGESTEITMTELTSDVGSTVYHLEYETASGRTAEFTTLGFETVKINLLSEDDMTGSSPIAFDTSAE